MNNAQVAQTLENIADLLQIKEDNSFKVKAYRNAALSIYHLDEDINTIFDQDRLGQIPGVGKAVKLKVVEMLEKDQCTYWEELSREIPPTLLEMLAIPGIGHKTVKLVYERLGIGTVDQLYQAAVNKQLRNIPGLGAKSEDKIIKGIELLISMQDKMTLGFVLPIAQDLCHYLRALVCVAEVSPVGSVRRGKPLVSDLDVLVASRDEAQVRQQVQNYPRINSIKQEESGHIAGTMYNGLAFEVIIVSPEEYAEALFWTTGSKAHRSLVLGTNQRNILTGVVSEEEVYQRLDLDFIPPELRENRGEVEAARNGSLPRLLTPGDLKGDLHVHTSWSDGNNTLAEMAQAAQALDYEYLAITDHSRSLAISGGLSIERLLSQGEEIDRLNQSFDEFRLLKGIEVDILKDGSLDFPDDVLRKLDLVVASIHSSFNLDRESQTERMIHAIKNENVDIIGHLTGRMLKRRPGYLLDMEKILDACAKNHTALEINSSPDRLDIDEEIARQARDMGIKIAINSDAHHRNELPIVNYGILNARRGWVEKEDVLNTLDLQDLLERLT